MYARQKLRIAKAILRQAVRRCISKKLHAVGPEKLQTEGTEKRHGVTETYKALPRKDIFRTPEVQRKVKQKEQTTSWKRQIA